MVISALCVPTKKAIKKLGDLTDLLELFCLAATWPQVFDDSEARKDWGWNHHYGLDELCEVNERHLF